MARDRVEVVVAEYGERLWPARAGLRRIAAIAPLAVFITALAVQFQGPTSVIGTDGVEYVTSGVNLAGRGVYENATGQAEIWVPPLYPALIGIASGAGAIDPFLVARLIAGFFGCLAVLLTTHLGRLAGGGRLLPGVVAGLLLALSPTYQVASESALSEAVAAALALSAAWFWWTATPRTAWVRYSLIGAFTGLAYLTRPEWLVLLPLLALVEAVVARSWRIGTQWLVAGAIFLACALPYVAWVSYATASSSRTGATELVRTSTRGQIVLASGRASYYGHPRERLDPATGELKIWMDHPTAAQEARRYLWNWTRILGGYARAFGGALAVFVAAAALTGAIGLVRAGDWRTLLGLACFLAYLPVVAALDFKPRYLVGSLPALSILAGLGAAAAVTQLWRHRTWTTGSIAAIVLVAGLGATLVSAGAASLRPPAGAGPGGLLRRAGRQLRAMDLRPGVLYEPWLEAAYYSGQRAHVLTCDELPTVLAYINHREPPGTPVRILVSSFASCLGATVRALLDHPKPGLKQLLRLRDEHGIVVVYELERAGLARLQPAP